MPPSPRSLVAGLLAAGALCALAPAGAGASGDGDEPAPERGAREVEGPAVRLAVSDGART